MVLMSSLEPVVCPLAHLVEGICLKVGNLILMYVFHCAIRRLCLFLPKLFGHGLFGDLEEGIVLIVVLFPHLKCGVNPQS